MTEIQGQSVHQETQALLVHRERGETEASQGQEESTERLGHRVHPENLVATETLECLEQQAFQGQQDHLEILYGSSSPQL